MDTIELSDFDIKPSSSTYGVELLMNDKSKTSSSNSKKDSDAMSDINLDDINILEQELNDLSFTDTMNVNQSGNENIGIHTMFESDVKNNVSFDNLDDDMDLDKPALGKMSSKHNSATTSTWDGFQKFDDIPLHNVDKSFQSQPSMTKEELQKEKFSYLRKLETLERKGVELSKKYDMESSLNEMMGEYETIMEEKNKANSVKFQGNMLMAVINGLEFLNNKIDPFDLKLDGWGEQISDNMNDYDDIFGELYEKYKTKASMAPELKLLFQLAGSGIMIHMSNTLFRSAMPSMDDIMRQNPDLMRHFQSAAVNSMAPKNPGFSGFVNGIMGQGNNPPPIPPPMKTQTMDNTLYQSRGGNNTSGNGNKIFSEQNNQQSQSFTKSQRPEMKGPSDISSILSNLKTKTINVTRQSNDIPPPPFGNLPGNNSQRPSSRASSGRAYSPTNTNDNSVISISDLKDLQNGDFSAPKRGRKKKSDKSLNTVNINI
jgi:hypothetical protein